MILQKYTADSRKEQFMARLTGQNIEQYRASNTSNGPKVGYFSLKNDKDTAKIRLLYNGADDIDGYTVHRVKVGDYEKPVNCLSEDGAPIDACPFCMANIKKQARVWIPVYDESDNAIKFWERPNNFYGKLTGLCSRYPNIVSQLFEVERRGEAGYQKTDYDFYPIGSKDGTTIEDLLDDCGLDELPKALGTKVLNKTADEMDYYLEHGEFPSSQRSDDTPVRRRSTSDDDVAPRRRNRDVSSRGDRF